MAKSTIKKLQTPKWTLLKGIKSSDLAADTYNNVTLTQNINHFSLLRINTSYFTSGSPDYGGMTISTSGLHDFYQQPIVIYGYDNEYKFYVRYVNNTTISTKFIGEASETKCLSIHGIL